MALGRLAQLVAGMAIGSAVTVWWLSRRAGSGETARPDTRTPQQPAPQWLSDRRGADSAIVDDAVEDTFPASDPPAFMQSVVVGPPPHELDEAAAVRPAAQGQPDLVR